jgi:hypothetical protein
MKKYNILQIPTQPHVGLHVYLGLALQANRVGNVALKEGFIIIQIMSHHLSSQPFMYHLYQLNQHLRIVYSPLGILLLQTHV